MMDLTQMNALLKRPAALIEGQHEFTIRSATQNIARRKNGSDYEYLLINVTDMKGNQHDGLKINTGLTAIESAKFVALWKAAMGAKAKFEVASGKHAPQRRFKFAQKRTALPKLDQ